MGSHVRTPDRLILVAMRRSADVRSIALVSVVESLAPAKVHRALVGNDTHLAIGVECTLLYSPTRENLAAKIGAVWKAGADSFYCYNYGLMPLQSLEWL